MPRKSPSTTVASDTEAASRLSGMEATRLAAAQFHLSKVVQSSGEKVDDRSEDCGLDRMGHRGEVSAGDDIVRSCSGRKEGEEGEDFAEVRNRCTEVGLASGRSKDCCPTCWLVPLPRLFLFSYPGSGEGKVDNSR